MKRIILWIDCEEEDLEETPKRIRDKLKSVGSWFKIVAVNELEWPSCRKEK